jgi:thymidylate kinase
MNNKWNIAGLILEGVCGTGKTTLLRALLQSKRFLQKSFLSSLVLSEHQTQRVLEYKEQKKGLSITDNIALLNQHITYLQSIHDKLEHMPWSHNNRNNMRFPYILERFHFTHVSHYQHISWEDVTNIDSRLAPLNCKLCLLTMDNSQFRDRIINSRNSEWRDYLKKYGNTNDKILDYYTKQQDLLLNLCEKSELDTFVVNTTEITVERTVEQVLDFWNIA